jgi:hypothetical protein
VLKTEEANVKVDERRPEEEEKLADEEDEFLVIPPDWTVPFRPPVTVSADFDWVDSESNLLLLLLVGSRRLLPR